MLKSIDIFFFFIQGLIFMKEITVTPCLATIRLKREYCYGVTLISFINKVFTNNLLEIKTRVLLALWSQDKCIIFLSLSL